MTGSPASVSVDGPGRVLVCGVNWIGDTVMSLPALQAYREASPDVHLALLVKPALIDVWAMSAVPDQVLPLERGPAGLIRTVQRLRAERFERAYVLPHSFRSALLPFLARIPERHGMPGHGRDFMLTRVTPPKAGPGRDHQAYEYLDLLAPGSDTLDDPVLHPDRQAKEQARALLGTNTEDWIGFLPGAARGPSKRWPAAHFVELGRTLHAEQGLRIAVMGGPDEGPLCEEIAAGVGGGAINLAGRTSLPVWAAVLAACAAVVSNDSGGMHLAAAAGTPVVALFGITDPAKTGPLGPVCIIQHAGRRCRDVPRDSREARLSLASITPQEVYEAVCTAVMKS